MIEICHIAQTLAQNDNSSGFPDKPGSADSFAERTRQASHSCWICSSVLPRVSGTIFQINTKATADSAA
jgi:hypothetical protein